MKRVGVFLCPGFQALDMAAVTVFELANRKAPEPIYALEILSEHGGMIASSAGIRCDTARFQDPAFDTILLAGTMGIGGVSSGLLAFLRNASAASRRTASICTGAFILAEAGLLDGRRATTHWAYTLELKRRFPTVRVDEDRIFIADGNIWTSAGMTACIDLALALVEADLGSEIARAIARTMVVYHRRPGGQSQFSALLDLAPKTDRIQNALAFAKGNLRADLSVEQLAEVARLSPRQFSRAFRSETGQSPAKAVENLRVEAARVLIEAGRLSSDVVARETGFADPERMRRAFLRAFGQPPQAIKRAARFAAAI
jgi:transcriptional regulator GlxA family with amidase domain